MNFHKTSLQLAFGALLLLASCTDNNYDLDQLSGSTVRIAVNELTVPVKLDAITLDSILELNDSSIIKRVNGSYAAVKEDFIKESDDIKINEIRISKPEDVYISNVITHEKIDSLVIPYPDMPIPDNLSILRFNIPTDAKDLNLKADNIDNAVQSIMNVGLSDEETLSVSIEFNNINGIRDFSIKDLKIQLPKGLVPTEDNDCDYDPETGIADFGTVQSKGLKIAVHLTVNGIDVTDRTPEEFTFTPGKKDDKKSKGKLTFNQKIHVVDGYVFIEGRNLTTKTLAVVNEVLSSNNIKYEAKANFARDFSINSFSGDVYYAVDGINVSPVVLSDLPGILNQTGTAIGLDNPQLYISVNNPILNASDIKVIPTAMLGLTKKVKNHASGELSPDDGAVALKFADNVAVLAPRPDGVSYVSPTDPEHFNFTNINTPVKFTAMSGLLMAETAERDTRLPDSILVRIDPKVEQTVSNLKLMNYGKVSGKYAFYAPIHFTSDSKIVYNDTIDGMNTEAVDKMVVDKLNLGAALTTDMPVNSLTLELIPFEYTNDWTDNFDKETRPKKFRTDLRQEVVIAADGSGVITGKEFKIAFDPKEKGLPSIQHLGGIVLNARINASNKDALKPSQKIRLTNIKASISGYYDTKL